MATRGTWSRGQHQQQTQKPDQSRARWTLFLTKMFADIMVDQVRKGNRVNNSFTKKAWKLICDDFYKKTGLKWDLEQLKNRYAVLRRQHVIVKSLSSRSDFTLDEATGAIVAEEEAWMDYIKDHPDADAIRTSGCPINKQLCEIFAEPATNGRHDRLNEMEMENPTPIPILDPLLNPAKVESSSEHEPVDDTANDQDSVQFATPSSTSANKKRGRKGIDDVIAEAILEMAAASKMRTAAWKQLSARFSVTQCIRELDQIHGLGEHLYFAALDLFNSPKARETFLSLKNNKRLAWLQWKCASSCNTLS